MVTEATQLHTNTLHAALPIIEPPKVYYSTLNLLAASSPATTSDNNSLHLNLADHYINPTTLLVGLTNLFYGPYNFCPPDLWKSQGCNDLYLLYNLIVAEEQLTNILHQNHYTQSYIVTDQVLPLANAKEHYYKWAKHHNFATAF